jgi:hypothetical protein
MDTKERAKEIRRLLKSKLGANSRQVSVRTDYFSMGSAINVVIKDAKFELADVEAVTEQFETIHRCELTGDILGGGNTYVTVQYDMEVKKERREAKARAAAEPEPEPTPPTLRLVHSA